MPYETKTHRYTTQQTQYTLRTLDGGGYYQAGQPTYPLFSSQGDLLDYFNMREGITPHLDCLIETIKTVRVENIKNPSVLPYTIPYTTPLTTLKRNGKLTSEVARTADAWFNDRLPCYYHEGSIPFEDRVELFAHHIGKILQDNYYEDGDGIVTSWEIDTIFFSGEGQIRIHVDDAKELNALSRVTIFDMPTGTLAGSYVDQNEYDERDARLKPTFTWEAYDRSRMLGSVDLNVYEEEPFVSEPDPDILTTIPTTLMRTFLIESVTASLPVSPPLLREWRKISSKRTQKISLTVCNSTRSRNTVRYSKST